MISIDDLSKLIEDAHDVVDANLKFNTKINRHLLKIEEAVGNNAFLALRQGCPLLSRCFGQKREFIIKSKKGKKLFHKRMISNPLFQWTREKIPTYNTVTSNWSKYYLKESFLPAKISNKIWGRVHGEK